MFWLCAKHNFSKAMKIWRSCLYKHLLHSGTMHHHGAFGELYVLYIFISVTTGILVSVYEIKTSTSLRGKFNKSPKHFIYHRVSKHSADTLCVRKCLWHTHLFLCGNVEVAVTEVKEKVLVDLFSHRVTGHLAVEKWLCSHVHLVRQQRGYTASFWLLFLSAKM